MELTQRNRIPKTIIRKGKAAVDAIQKIRLLDCQMILKESKPNGYKWPKTEKMNETERSLCGHVTLSDDDE